MSDQQTIIVWQNSKIVYGADALVLPDDIAVPVVFDNSFVRSSVQQVSIGQQPTTLIEKGNNIPGVYDIAIHIE